MPLPCTSIGSWPSLRGAQPARRLLMRTLGAMCLAGALSCAPDAQPRLDPARPDDAGPEAVGPSDAAQIPPDAADPQGDAGAAAPDASGSPDSPLGACHAPVRLGPLSARTAYGALEGSEREGVASWLGVPYAAPPVGQWRWREPQPPVCWGEGREAKAFSNICPQYLNGEMVGQEDCLALNVWAPAQAGRAEPVRPVLVFLHGGGHQQGAGNVELAGLNIYDGHLLAKSQGLVVVTLNYRLGPFGFLAHPALRDPTEPHNPGANYGMLDQIAALAWVRDNIRAFGGDPDNVTLVGQSAGSVSACRLLVAPKALGLFQRAVLHSGACVASPRDATERRHAALVEDIGCARAQDVRACMRQKSAAEWMALVPTEVNIATAGRQTFDGVVDGALLAEMPRTLLARGAAAPVPVMLGTTADETGASVGPLATEAAYRQAVEALVVTSRGAPDPALAERILTAYPASDFDSPRKAFVAVTSDSKFTCQTRTDARLFADRGQAPVYHYRFVHLAERAGPATRERGVVHGAELLFLFGALEIRTAQGTYVPGPQDLATRDAMQAMWANFARDQAPGEGLATEWPVFTRVNPRYLELSAAPQALDDLHRERCDFWDSLTQ